MLPFSMKCLLCNEYIAARRKFNARKEITAEKYLDVKIIKFHIKCPRCNGQLVFRTDPKSSGFEPVSGAVRNYVSKGKEHKPEETEDEMLERLERQERENQEFQQQKQKRKNNPFWQAQLSSGTMDSLEEKLLEQQKEQEMHDHLTYLHAKAAKFQEAGGADAAIERAQTKLTEDRQDIEEPKPKKLRPEPVNNKAIPMPTVLRKIRVNLANLGNLALLKTAGEPKVKTEIAPPAENNQENQDLAHELPKSEEKIDKNNSIADQNQSPLLATLGGYSSSED